VWEEACEDREYAQDASGVTVAAGSMVDGLRERRPDACSEAWSDAEGVRERERSEGE
jgi:hypothetical protein